MNLLLILNELSLEPKAQDSESGKRRLTQFIKTVVTATSNGASKSIRSINNLHFVEVAPGYHFSQWRNDPTVDIEEKRFFKSLVTKSPVLEEQELATFPNYHLTEVSFKKQPSNGLRACYFLDALALSFISSDLWNVDCLEVEIDELKTPKVKDKDNCQLSKPDLEVLKEFSTIKHASSEAHINGHKAWFQTKKRIAILSGNVLWNQKETIFPHLRFCENIKSVIVGLNQNDRHLEPTIKRLFELEEHSAAWTSGSFDIKTLPSKASPESQSTLDKYNVERTFSCPDGVSRVFSLHVRLTPGAWRLHFFPLQYKMTIIGYVGPKLPTVNSPT
jgi:hypothetical protein